MRTRWKDLSPQKKRLLAVVVALEIISTIFAFRDMADRSDAEIRGTKRFWRVMMLTNTGNSILYWLFGRR